MITVNPHSVYDGGTLIETQDGLMDYQADLFLL
jgi:hypothetical protein